MVASALVVVGVMENGELKVLAVVVGAIENGELRVLAVVVVVEAVENGEPKEKVGAVKEEKEVEVVKGDEKLGTENEKGVVAGDNIEVVVVEVVVVAEEGAGNKSIV